MTIQSEKIIQCSDIVSKIRIYSQWLLSEVMNRYGKSCKEVSRIQTITNKVVMVQNDCNSSVQKSFSMNIQNLPGTDRWIGDLFHPTGKDPGPELRLSERVRPLPKTLNMEALGNLYDYMELINQLTEVNDTMFEGKNQNIQTLIQKSKEIDEILDL